MFKTFNKNLMLTKIKHYNKIILNLIFRYETNKKPKLQRVLEKP